MAAPYVSQSRTTHAEDHADLTCLLAYASWNTPGDRQRMVRRIMKAGFTRPRPARVTRLQLWSYFWETATLALCAFFIGPVEHPFIFGSLVAYAFFGAATYVGALVINHNLKAGAFL
jgi:hypothetical protein